MAETIQHILQQFDPEILIPAFGSRTGYAYCKLKRKQGDWATAASAVVLRLDGETCPEGHASG